MSLAKAGIPKSLNIKAQSGSLNAMKASFASATRAQGVSYGIMAQRSIFSTNALTNPKLAYSPEVASTRGMLLADAMALRIKMPDVQPRLYNNDNSMNKFMMGMVALNTLSEMTAGITKGIKDIKASKADRTEKPTEKPKANPEVKSDTLEQSKMEKYTSNLKSNGQSIATLGQEYKSLAIQGELPQLSELGINGLQDLNLQNLNLSDLNLSDSSSISDINTAINTISTDVNKVSQFQNKLAQNIGKLNSAYGTATAENKPKILEAINKLTAFQNNNLKTFAKNVNDQEEKLKNLRADKMQIMNNIAEQAEKDDNQIKKNNDKMKELKSDIQDAKNKNKGTKVSELIDKYNNLADENVTLSNSLKSLGTIQKVNSNFETSPVTLTNLAIATTSHYTEENGA